MALVLVEADQGGTLYASARVSLVSWEGRSHALLFMVPLGLPSARPMAQVLRLPFEYYYYITRLQLFRKKDNIIRILPTNVFYYIGQYNVINYSVNVNK